MKFFIKDLFSKCDQIRRKLRIWSHLLKKSLTENFIFCAMIRQWYDESLNIFIQNLKDVFRSNNFPLFYRINDLKNI